MQPLLPVTNGFFNARWQLNLRRTVPNCPQLTPAVALSVVRLRLKCDGTRAETEFRLSAKRTSPFKSTGASVHSTTGSRGVRISGSNAGHTMFRGSVKGSGYPLHSPVSPSHPLPCVTVCHHISTGLYQQCSSTKGRERNEDRKKCRKRMSNRGISSVGKKTRIYRNKDIRTKTVCLSKILMHDRCMNLRQTKQKC